MVRVNVADVVVEVPCELVDKAVKQSGRDVWIEEWFSWLMYNREEGELLACVVLGDGDDIECTDITWLIKKCRGD